MMDKDTTIKIIIIAMGLLGIALVILLMCMSVIEDEKKFKVCKALPDENCAVEICLYEEFNERMYYESLKRCQLNVLFEEAISK